MQYRDKKWSSLGTLLVKSSKEDAVRIGYGQGMLIERKHNEREKEKKAKKGKRVMHT